MLLTLIWANFQAWPVWTEALKRMIFSLQRRTGNISLRTERDLFIGYAVHPSLAVFTVNIHSVPVPPLYPLKTKSDSCYTGLRHGIFHLDRL